MRTTAWTAALVLMLDQASKYIVVHGMGLDRAGAIDLLPPWLNLRMAWNQGINFGLFSGEDAITRWGLVALALGIALWVWLWIGRGRHDARVTVSAGLLIGGALGNVIDRIAYGAVADFLNMSLPIWQNPYSFNIADIAIFLGAAGLVLFTGEADTKRRR
ncbi:signal peptidase II [Rhodobacter maris]|uniref:Lipoprotein signal peptidase n=1 Tax=Rhodobacter maris TaxID=446682 RepID=A0A285RMZ5_9RHOB|nr:signal peptidase II [Rhodobacter maris]SOB95078.1 signal peptidase II [Rhodobacter maris]